MATLTKEFKAISWESNEEMIITADEYNQYEKGELARNSHKLLSVFAATNMQPTQREFTTYRDHISVLVHFSDGNRSGVTANIQE